MRNIKFRGFSKNLTNNEWVYGDLVNYSETEKIIVEQNSKTWDLLEGGIIIDEKSIGQFTGLNDKNGKEIYEGDIILFQTFSNWDDESMKRHKATVIFKEGCFMWKILEYGKKSNFYHANETEPLRNTNCTWGLEIIGNIFENADLVKL